MSDVTTKFNGQYCKFFIVSGSYLCHLHSTRTKPLLSDSLCKLCSQTAWWVVHFFLHCSVYESASRQCHLHGSWTLQTVSHRRTCLTACSRHQRSSLVDVFALLTPRHYKCRWLVERPSATAPFSWLQRVHGTWDSGLLLTFDIPEGDQQSLTFFISHTVRLRWRRLLRWSGDICIELCSSFKSRFL